MAMMLLQANATVTICHSTQNLADHIKQADIIVAPSVNQNSSRKTGLSCAVVDAGYHPGGW